MKSSPTLIEQSNLSKAWLLVLKRICDNSDRDITPLLLSITDFRESEGVRAVLDKSLRESGFNSIQTVSETIFPNSLYEYCNQDKSKLYETYLKNLRRLKKIDIRNKSGTYFERLIDFEDTNQLDIIINALNSKRIRRSKLQASVFNPKMDHINSAYQGFPCLQHVTFYKSGSNGLILNSFYAIQYVYKKAYGNWLGLINLGKFIANETGLELERVNCFVGAEHLDENLTKSQARELLTKLETQLELNRP
jgi:thymidylate synthase